MTEASVPGSERLMATPEDAVATKVFWRLLPFLFVLYVVAYLDRINIGFGALSMNKELGLTATMFGLSNTIFYAGYLLCEVPSNLLLVRYGAHRWIPRIMITWGLASAATMFAVGPNSLYVLRLLVGIAEAGFLPGVLLYMTFWFPHHWRGRANAIFMVAQPLTIMFGATISGLILNMHGFLGLAGWRWLFLLEGIPAVLLGIIAWFYLDPGPEQARWLSREETQVLRSSLAQQERPAPPRTSFWAELATAPVILLCLSYFGLVTSLNTLATWTPQIVRELVSTQGSYAALGLLSALPALIAAIAMPIWSAHSDKSGERLLHYSVPATLTGLGWLLVIAFHEPSMRMLGLTMATAGAFTAMAIFWTAPAAILSERARPIGIAVVSSAGILGSVVSPSVIGLLRDLSGSFTAGVWYAIVLIAVSIVAMFIALRTFRQRGSESPLQHTVRNT